MTKSIESREAQEMSELEQTRALFHQISAAIHAALDDMTAGDADAAKTLGAQSQLLHKTAVQIMTLKEQFNAKHGPDIREGEFDLEQARFDIGCKLARIATCCDAGRLSCSLEPE